MVRCRGGNLKWRALRLNEGNYSWGTEQCTRKARILDVVYNASSNELVRTKTLVKGAIVQIDSTPFRNWYERHYGIFLGKVRKAAEAKKKKETAPAAAAKAAKKKDVKTEEKKEGEKKEPKEAKKKVISKERLKRWAKRSKTRELEKAMEHQFKIGRLFARISSRPGQIGHADGYILEGAELQFYLKKIEKKKAQKKP